MRKAKSHVRGLVTALVCASWLALSYACAVDDDNPVVPRRAIDSGSGAISLDGDLDLSDANGAPICASYGGVINAQQIALAVLQTVKVDCRLTATVTQTTTANHSIQCFQNFVAASFQCEGKTPQAGYTDDVGAPCSRPIDDTLSDFDFDTFIELYRAVLLDKGLSAPDVELVIPALLAARPFVVGDGVQEGKYTRCSGNCRDAGAACVRDAGAPPRDAGQDSGPRDSGPRDTGAPRPDTGAPDTGAPVDSGSDSGS